MGWVLRVFQLDVRHFRWGDGKSRKDVSPYEFSETPSPQINRPGKHNVPGMIHPSHYMPDTIHKLWCKWQGCINAGTSCFWDCSFWGPGVPETLFGDTTFRDVPSPHQIFKLQKPASMFFSMCPYILEDASYRYDASYIGTCTAIQQKKLHRRRGLSWRVPLPEKNHSPRMEERQLQQE